MLFFKASLGFADSRQVTQYSYDASGNIVAVDSDQSSNPPTVILSDLGSIRIGSERHITLSGSDLSNLMLSTDDASLIATVIATSATDAEFLLKAIDGAQLGSHTINLRTSLGATSAQINVLPRPPELEITPNPMVLSDMGQTLSVRIALKFPDAIDHELNIALSSAGVVDLSTNSLTIVSGQTDTSTALAITSLAEGKTNLSIASETLGEFSFTVTVAADFSPTVGQVIDTHTTSLGILKQGQTGELLLRGPLYSILGVFKGEPLEAEDSLISGVVSQQLNLLKGAGILNLSPKNINAGQGPITLTVTGVGLGDVDAVNLFPSDGVTLGLPTAEPDGSSVSFPLTVSADTALSLRQLRLSANGSALMPVHPDSDRLHIGGSIPSISHIQPITVPRQSTLPLQLVGESFQEITAVTIDPPEGVTISTAPEVIDPQNIEVQIDIDEFAALGPRVVRVHSVTGSSTSLPLPANTLTITNGPGEQLTPLAALPLGINKSDGPQPQTRDIEVHSNARLSVIKGAVLSAITPNSAAVGDSLSLTINGHNLSTVDSIAIEPAEGIAISNILANPNGLSVTADINIDADAATTLRRLSLSANGLNISSATVQAERFRITPPQPQLNYVTPLFLVAGEPPVEMNIYGELLAEVSAVTVTPSQGIVVSTPDPDPSGQFVSVQISAAADAQLIQRVIVVQTPGGSSSLIADATNSIDIVSGLGAIVTPVIAPILGIEKQVADVGTDTDYFVASGLLGVEKTFTSPPQLTAINITSSLLKVAKGPVAETIAPAVVQTGTNQNLVITGNGLAVINSLSFVPDIGISSIGSPSLNPEGTELTQLVSVAIDAPKQLHQVVLNSAAGPVEYSDPSRSRILVAGELPTIESVSPIQQVQGSFFEMTIRGQRLESVTAVSSAPAEGIVFGALTANPDGTELRVQVSIDNFASLGAKAIVLTTPLGSTASTADATNTFTVVD